MPHLAWFKVVTKFAVKKILMCSNSKYSVYVHEFDHMARAKDNCSICGPFRIILVSHKGKALTECLDWLSESLNEKLIQLVLYAFNYNNENYS